MKKMRLSGLPWIAAVLCFMLLTHPYSAAAQRAASEPSSAPAVTSIEPLNPIALQVTFSAPIMGEDLQLDKAKANFVFDNGLVIRNIPQLKTGAVSTYIVPTTVQTPGTSYTLKYKGQNPFVFTGSGSKLPLQTARQVSYDTFELESSLKDGVTDYTNIVQADVGKRPGMEFALDEKNQYQGKKYQIIPSLRDSYVTITPDGGKPIKATYVPFTQGTDGRQAPKFRLPEGIMLKPGQHYTVNSDWATIQTPDFKAKRMKPLKVQQVKAVNDTTLEVTLTKDPKDEVFASRRIVLTAPDGTALNAQYKVETRKGPTGTFELQNGGKLQPGVSYTVKPAGEWAKTKGHKLTVKL